MVVIFDCDPPGGQKGHTNMAVDKAVIDGMKTEEKRLRGEADALAKAIATLTGGDAAPAEPTAKKSTAKKGTAKPAAKKTGERKPRVPVEKVSEIVHEHLKAHPGSSISDIEEAHGELNRPGITKALKLLIERGLAAEAGKEGRSVKYESTADGVEAKQAPSEEAVEVVDVVIDPTLAEAAIEVDDEPEINFGE